MLASRQCASGYSGEKADIWAAGILLFVMLLGTFPFDHDLKHDPNSGEAAGEVWLKQQQGSWRQHPKAADVVNRGALSADCCQLLDQLLEMDEVSQVIANCWSALLPWMTLIMHITKPTAATELLLYLQPACWLSEECIKALWVVLSCSS